MNAAFIAIGMEADVFVFDRSIDRLRELDIYFGGPRLDRLLLDARRSRRCCRCADLVIGAVLVHGARAPHVITREQLELMKRNAVLVDVSIDQGGCFETSRPTTHSDPTYEVDGITHYCVDEHARRRPDHLDLRAHERDAALRALARRPRRRGGDRARPGPALGRERRRRPGHPSRPWPKGSAMPYVPLDDVFGPSHGEANRDARRDRWPRP